MADRAAVERLIELHQGVIAKMADDAEGLRVAGLADRAITSGALSRKLAALGLRQAAAAARAAARLGGRRDELPHGLLDPVGERAALVQALKQNGNNVAAAAAAVGMPVRLFYKRMDALDVPRAAHPSKAARRRELIAQLRKYDWSVNALAKAEGVAAASMQGRLDRAGINRAEINRRRLAKK